MTKKHIGYGILTVLCIGITCLTGRSVYESRMQQDVNEPRITFENYEVETEVASATDVLLEGVKASDKEDGNVTDSLMIENITKKIDGAYNEFLITYVAFDSANNRGRATRVLRYTDYQAPRFVIKKPLRFTVESEVNLTDYITAEDMIDGDLTAFIKVTGLDSYQNEKTEGIYECKASVTNSVGDVSSIPIKVEFYTNTYEEQTTRPKVILKEYVTYLEKGSNFYAGDYLDYIIDNGNKSIDYGELVEIQNGEEITYKTQAEIDQKPGAWVNVQTITCETNLDTDVPGIYKAVYTYTSLKEEYTGTAELVIVVEN